MRVIVLGAGITGVCTAWFLRKLGHEITVVDRQPDCALETSFANGGQISVSQSEPWANPGAPLKILKWLGRDDSPLLFRPRLEWRQWEWGFRFLRECFPGAARHNIEQMVNLGLYSRKTLQALRSETGIEYHQQTRGILQLHFDQQSFDQACGGSEIMRALGCDREAVTVERALALEPALASVRNRLIGATYAPGDESGDARLFCSELRQMAEAAGVVFQLDTCVLALETENNDLAGVRVRSDGRQCYRMSADAYVMCLGSYSPNLLSPIGVRVPIYPAKGYSATMSITDTALAPTISITDDDAKMVYTRLGDRIRIAGTAEMAGYNTDLNMVRCQALLTRYFSIFPDSADAQSAQFWTGLRPSTPSNVPVIGRSKYSRLYLNTGHGTLGWTEGPGSGKAIAEIIHGKEPDLKFDFWRA